MAKKANDLTLSVGFDIDKFNAELNKTTGVLNKWGAGIQNSLLGVAAGFSALAIGEFVLDVSKLAGEAEGVRVAFEKLPNSIKLMRELKEATAGTVSELDLMKRSVMAANFGINIEALPKLLEFAAVRAKQTGQSVSFLADSIVTGIGRKSALILDNLGISLAAINEELKVTPDYAQAVGNIAERELAKMGGMSENASTKVERLGASWVNLKVYMGEVANGTGLLGTALDDLTKKTDILASRNLSFLEKLLALIYPAQTVAAITKDIAMEAINASEAQRKQNEIIDTAIHLYSTLGLDFEALQNVAGDNVNVMEIWAHMQKLAAESAAQTTTTVQQATVAMNNYYKTITDGLQLGGVGVKDVAHKDPLAGFNPDAFASMNAALTGLQAANDLVTESFARQREEMIQHAAAAAQVGESIGFTLAQAASGQITMAQAVSRSSMIIIDELQKQALAAIIAKAAFGPLGTIAAVGLAAFGFGAIKGLFAKIGARGGAGGAGSYAGGYSSTSVGGSRSEGLGQRIIIEMRNDAGKVFKAKMIEQDRIDNRTRASYPAG